MTDEVAQYRKKINNLLLEHSHSTRRYEEERKALKIAKAKVKVAEEAQVVLQTIAQGVQQHAHDDIANIVTRCIKTVYGEDSYKFKIDFEKKRGKTEAKIIFEKNGFEHDPMSGTGGGVVDIAALGLRLACIMLNKPRLRKLIIADEPFKNINGEEYRERAAELLQTLSEEMEIQFIIVNGQEWLNIGRVIEIDK